MQQRSLITVVSPSSDTLALIGHAANAAAARNVLEDYQARKSRETLRRQAADIALFARFLASAGVLVPDMVESLEAWSSVTWGLVEAFNHWQLSQGYAIGSINVHLATVKTYCELAAKAGVLPAQALALIKTVKGYKRIEGRNQDEKRAETRRPEAKKAAWTSLSLKQARALKAQPGTKKGRRDALLMCLLLDYGLRCSEIAALDVAALNLDAGTLTFYRHKVDKVQTLHLSEDAKEAARTYLEHDCTGREQDAPLFTGPCSKRRISVRTINARLAALGAAIGLDALSPHDCRHYWATNAVRSGTDIKSLQDAGGWSSPAMPLRYAESSRIANEGVKLTV